LWGNAEGRPNLRLVIDGGAVFVGRFFFVLFFVKLQLFSLLLL